MGGNTSRESYSKQLTEIVAQSVINIKTDCSTNVALTQTMQVDCATPVIAGRNFADNASAQLCVEATGNASKAFAAYQLRVVNELSSRTNDPLLVSATSSAERAEITTLRGKMCNMVVASCIFTGNTQTASATYNVECLTDANIVSKLKADVTSQLEQKLTEQKDALALFANALQTGDDTQRTISEVTNRVNTAITVDKILEMGITLQADQTMEIAQGSHSTVFARNSQQSELALVANAISKTRMFETADIAVVLDVVQTQVDKNDTIGDIAREIDRTVDSVAGGAKAWMVAVLVTIVVLCVAFASIMLWLTLRSRKKRAAEATARAQSKETSASVTSSPQTTTATPPQTTAPPKTTAPPSVDDEHRRRRTP